MTAPPVAPLRVSVDLPPEASPQEDHGFKKLFARGSAWALVNHGITQGIRLGSNLIFWRLLYPEAFGLMAIANAIAIGLAMFTDIGVGQSVIQNPRGDDPTFLNTIWSIQVVRGLAIAVMMCGAALPIARFYGEPQLAGILMLAGLSVAISAFNSTNLFTASRHLALRKLTIIDLSSQLCGLVVMLVCAYLTRSVWSLAIGGLVPAAVRLYLSHAILPGIRNRLSWDRETVQSISHFGRWVFVSSVFTFIASSSDRLIFGKLVTMEMLGIYSIAVVWASFPATVTSNVESSVLFPLFSRAHGGKGGDLSATFRQLRRPVLMGSGWLSACLLAGGPTLIRFLYDQRALEAGLTVQILTAGYWFHSLASMSDAAMLALGKPRWIALGNVAKVAGMAILMPVGSHLFGFQGAVAGLSAATLIRYVVVLFGVSTQGLRPLLQDLRLTAGILATTAGALMVGSLWRMRGLHVANGRIDAFLEGTCMLLVLTAAWAAVFVALRRRGSAPAHPIVSSESADNVAGAVRSAPDRK